MALAAGGVLYGHAPLRMSRRHLSLLGGLILSAGVIAGAAGASAQSGAGPAKAAVGDARALEALGQAKRALTGRSERDATLALARLAIVAPRLSGDEAEQADALLARPTSKNDPLNNEYRVKEQKPLCSPHFCVHWVKTTKDAPSLKDANGTGIPDYVESAALIAELSYLRENRDLGWAPPKRDGKLGGGGRTDIYLSQLGDDGLYGYAATDPRQGRDGGRPPRSVHSYLVIDQNFSKREFNAPPLKSLQVTLAHEYNHVLQYSYDLYQDAWSAEATATWMEDRVFPAADDYLQYLTPWVRRTTVPLTFFTNSKVYGSAVWNHWLAAKYGPEVVRNTWAGADRSKPVGFAANAYNRAIGEQGDSTFSRDFASFAADTAEWRVSGVFPEGASYPDVRRSGDLRSGQADSGAISHTGYVLVDIEVPKGGKSLRLNVRVRSKASAGIALVGRQGRGAGAKVVVRDKFLKNGGRSSISLGNPAGYSRITAVLVNADIRQRGYSGSRQDWLYSRDSVPFQVSVKAGA